MYGWMGKILHIYINGINVPLTPKFLMDDVVFWFAGKEHTWKSVMEESSAANAVRQLPNYLFSRMDQGRYTAEIAIEQKEVIARRDEDFNKNFI